MKYTKGILSLLVFVLSLQSAFAVGNVFTKAFGVKDFTEFLTIITWLDWVIYFVLILIMTLIFRTMIPGVEHKGTRNLIAGFISFMGTTGLMWVLVNQNFFPTQIMLWVIEIIVVSLLFGFWWMVHNKFKDSEGKNKSITWITLIITLFNN
jgi:phosphoglycerol transferase MdoB-like AlkP superfamily enzyme